jgi:hypothetical protein
MPKTYVITWKDEEGNTRELAPLLANSITHAIWSGMELTGCTRNRISSVLEVPEFMWDDVK